MDFELQNILDQYYLAPTQQNLLECLNYLNMLEPYLPDILIMVAERQWQELYRERKALENSNGAIILRHLYKEVNWNEYLGEIFSSVEPASWSSGATPTIEAINIALLRSLAKAGDSVFVINQLQKFVNAIERGVRIDTSNAIQTCYNLAEIPQIPEPFVYQFLRELVNQSEISLVHAAAHTLGIIGTEADFPALIKSLETSQKLAGIPITCMAAIATIGGEKALKALLDLLTQSLLVFQGRLELPLEIEIIPYLIETITTLIIVERITSAEVNSFRQLLNATDQFNRAQSQWSRFNSHISEAINRAQRFLVSFALGANMPLENIDYAAIHTFQRAKHQYRGANPIITAHQVLKIATEKIGWSAPQSDENLNNWIRRVLTERRIDYLIPGSGSWEEARLVLENVINYAQNRDLFNAAQELYYLNVTLISGDPRRDPDDQLIGPLVPDAGDEDLIG